MRRTLAERLWEKAERRGPDECWPWLASFDRDYPQIAAGIENGGRVLKAHVVAYELQFGPLVSGMEVDHTCSNYTCMNPAHLEAVTRAENVRRQRYSRLTLDQYHETLSSSAPDRDLAFKFGVSPGYISRVRAGLTRPRCVRILPA